MSQTRIVKRFYVDNVLTDPTSIVLSNAGVTWGVRRTDTGAIVVVAGTAMTKLSTGRYYHSFTDPADGLTYEYAVKIIYGGETHIFTGTCTGGTDTSENLYDLVPLLAPYVPGCPDALMKQNLRLAAQQFCRESGAWVEKLSPFDSEADEDEYTLTIPYEAYVREVLQVDVDDVEQQIEKVSSNGQTITLTYAPTEDDLDIEATVVFVPKQSCTELPDWLIDRWGHGILAGAKMLLKSMAEKPWTDMNGMQIAANEFLAAVADAKAERLNQNGPGDVLQVSMRKFA